MTAGDVATPASRRQLTRERLLRGHESRSTGPLNRQAAILFLGLTIVWLGVLWMAIFGSWPHTYFLIMAGTYTVGVLSGAGMSTLVFRRGTAPVPTRETVSPVDAEVRVLS
jgi:hypothetical protein